MKCKIEDVEEVFIVVAFILLSRVGNKSSEMYLSNKNED